MNSDDMQCLIWGTTSPWPKTSPTPPPNTMWAPQQCRVNIYIPPRPSKAPMTWVAVSKLSSKIFDRRVYLDFVHDYCVNFCMEGSAGPYLVSSGEGFFLENMSHLWGIWGLP